MGIAPHPQVASAELKDAAVLGVIGHCACLTGQAALLPLAMRTKHSGFTVPGPKSPRRLGKALTRKSRGILKAAVLRGYCACSSAYSACSAVSWSALQPPSDFSNRSARCSAVWYRALSGYR